MTLVLGGDHWSLTRTWGSEMSGEEEEESCYELLKKRLRDDWTGPDLVFDN